MKQALCGAGPAAVAFLGDAINDAVWPGAGAAGGAAGSPRPEGAAALL